MEGSVRERAALVIRQQLAGGGVLEVIGAKKFDDDFGCDDIDMLEIRFATEDEFDIYIKDEEWEAVLTVEDCFALVEKKLSGGSSDART